MTDATASDLSASLAISDRLSDQIEGLFLGQLNADCVFALAAVFGRFVGRNEAATVGEQFASFMELALLEARHVRARAGEAK
jgi:hypothetical protein